MMEVYSLFSGSEGNCILIRSGDTAILMDAGRTRRAIADRLAGLGMGLTDICGVFITHEHSDHVSALLQLSRHECMPIHAAGATAEYLSGSLLGGDSVIWHPPCFTEVIGGITVASFPLPHDSRCHVGYRFQDQDGDTFCAATDMGTITKEAIDAVCGCRGVLLEANHDIAQLQSGPYPAYLKARILSPRGHLSNEDCARLARHAVDHGVSRVALGHLSKENNTPEAALSAVHYAIPDTDIVVCDRREVTRIL